MKILFLNRSFDIGGAEQQLANLALGLHERGHDVRVASFYGGGAIEEGLHQAGVRLCDLEKRGRWDLAGFGLRLVSLIRRSAPDVVYGFLPVPNLLAAVLGPMCRSPRVVWGIRSSAFDLNQYDWLSRQAYVLERLLSSLPDLIVANSEAGMRHLAANGFPREKTVVVPNGIDTERFRPAPDLRRRVRAEWGVSDREPLIGLVARFDPLKDHRTFLSAAAILAGKRPDLRFVCVGDGPADYRTELHELGQSLGLDGRLIWAGERDDMPAVYNAFDFLCLSSFSEGFPNVVGEAMACGKPCVVTDVGDASAIVGNTGIVVPPRDPERLAQGCREMLDRLAVVNPPDTRQRILAEFGRDAMVSRMEHTLANVLSDSFPASDAARGGG